MNHPSTTIVVALAVIVIGAVIAVSGVGSGSNDTQAVTQESGAEVPTATATADVQLTDGRRHTIPLDKIVGGGPGKDGIPSIDNPQFTDPQATRSWLPPTARGIGVSREGATRFYPYAILVWHEIVNDQIGDQPLTVTYCPLCKTGIVFDPVVNGEVFEFGVSGKLWQSNLLMYNRTDNPDNESLWSQVLGEAVVGPLAGTKLNILPSTITTLDKWENSHPDTQVLARPEDSRRNYNRDPYAGYYDSSRVRFGAEFDDDRLDPKRLVYGIESGDQFKAYPADKISTGTTTDTINGQTIAIEALADNTVLFKNDSGQRIPHVTGFWFSWVSVHPNTQVFQPSTQN